MVLLLGRYLKINIAGKSWQDGEGGRKVMGEIVGSLSIECSLAWGPVAIKAAARQSGGQGRGNTDHLAPTYKRGTRTDRRVEKGFRHMEASLKLL